MKHSTLADFAIPALVLRCFHCDRILPGKAKAESSGKYIVVECPKCGLMTPFKVEKAS